MTVALLLRIKARLVVRSFMRKGGAMAAFGILGLVVALSPFWLGITLSAHRLVVARGADGVAAALGGVHLAWLFSSIMLSGFAEGFDWRLLLRFPVPPERIFLANVLIAPLDLVALFLLPPLAAAVLAASARGAGPALGAALASLLLLLLTGTLLNIVLAAFSRFLRRDWARAVGGLIFGVACAVPIFAFNHQLSAGRNPSLSALTESAGTPLAALAGALPTSAFPVLLARGLWSLDAGRAALGLLGGLALLWLGVRFGARLAAAAAREGEQAERARARSATARAPGRRPALLVTLARLLPDEIAVLTARDLRYFLRTPQILLGLLVTPLLVVFFYAFGPVPKLGRFALPFFCLVSALNLSANVFGLDREGVRLLLLLPIAPRRLLTAKNLACGTVVAATTILAVTAAAIVGRGGLFAMALGALATFAALPALLTVGNFLSVRHPWRMTFKIGGAPPGALASAVAQMAVVSAVAILLAIPPAVAAFFAPPPLHAVIEVGGTLLVALGSWSLWAALLGPAARELARKKESLIATLGYPHETG